MNNPFRLIPDSGINVSFYSNAYDYMPSIIDISEFLNDVQNGSYQNSIKKIRTEQSKLLKESLKLRLPKVSVSAVFSGIHDLKNIVSYTKLIHVDIDNVKHLQDAFDVLKDDIYIYSMFISPSGNGLKIIFKTEFEPKEFIFIYYSLEKYFLETYNLTIDKACKNINRLLTMSHDSGLYFNQNSTPFLSKYYPPAQTVTNFARPSTSKSTVLVENIISQIEKSKIDITSSYSDWLKIAFALVSEFGINGLSYFIDISKYHPEFNATKSEIQYRRCYKQGSKCIHIQSLYKIASWYGISYKN